MATLPDPRPGVPTVATVPPHVAVSLVGVADPPTYGDLPRGVVPWPPGWPAPREGDGVALPDVPGPLRVRLVEWCPVGDVDGDPVPFVYVVVGPPRPTS